MNPENQTENEFSPLESESEEITQEQEPRRLLSLWTGRHTFIMNGKILLGPNSHSWMPCLFLNFLGVLSVVFYFEILPKTTSIDPFLLAAGFNVCLITMLFFYCITIFVEPGVLPPEALIQNPHYFSTVDSLNIGVLKAISKFAAEKWRSENQDTSNTISNDSQPSLENQSNASPNESLNDCSKSRNPPDMQKTLGISLYKPNSAAECEPCKIVKLPHTGHCSTCDSCVRFYMGHSKVLNKCIGKRNYRVYFLFIIFGLLFAAFLGLSCFNMLNPNSNYAKIACVGVIVILLLEACLFGLILCCWLLYLLIKKKGSPKTEIQTIVRDSESLDVFWTSLPLIDFSKIIEPVVSSA